MSLIVFSGLFFPILLSGLSIYFFRLCNKNLKLLVAFSGAYLLSLTFNELIPYIFSGTEAACSHTHDHSHSSHTHLHINTMGLFILIGFFIQLILDYFTKGVEHGHVHSKCPEHENHHNDVESGLSYLPVMIGLCLHSFLEAMPLAKGFSSVAIQNQLLIGIIIHNIPLAIVLMSLFLQNGVSRNKSVFLLFLFALSGPAGVATSNLIGAHLIHNMDAFFKISMAIVVGIFLHISTTILFEADEDHSFNYKKFGVIILGVILAMIHF